MKRKSLFVLPALAALCLAGCSLIDFGDDDNSAFQHYSDFSVEKIRKLEFQNTQELDLERDLFNVFGACTTFPQDYNAYEVGECDLEDSQIPYGEKTFTEFIETVIFQDRYLAFELDTYSRVNDVSLHMENAKLEFGLKGTTGYSYERTNGVERYESSANESKEEFDEFVLMQREQMAETLYSIPHDITLDLGRYGILYGYKYGQINDNDYAFVVDFENQAIEDYEYQYHDEWYIGHKYISVTGALILNFKNDVCKLRGAYFHMDTYRDYYDEKPVEKLLIDSVTRGIVGRVDKENHLDEFVNSLPKTYVKLDLTMIEYSLVYSDGAITGINPSSQYSLDPVIVNGKNYVQFQLYGEKPFNIEYNCQVYELKDGLYERTGTYEGFVEPFELPLYRELKYKEITIEGETFSYMYLDGDTNLYGLMYEYSTLKKDDYAVKLFNPIISQI